MCMQAGVVSLTVFSLPLALGLPLTAGPPSFHKDIEAILERRCQGCHRAGEAAPMPLVTYEQTRPWAKAIRASVITGKMPPWQPDPHYGKFSNDLSLAPGEKEKLIAWVDGGAVEGNGSGARWNSSGVPEGSYTVSVRVDDGRGGTTGCSSNISVAMRPNFVSKARNPKSPGVK